jgi:hypothetical protein
VCHSASDAEFVEKFSLMAFRLFLLGKLAPEPVFRGVAPPLGVALANFVDAG